MNNMLSFALLAHVVSPFTRAVGGEKFNFLTSDRSRAGPGPTASTTPTSKPRCGSLALVRPMYFSIAIHMVVLQVLTTIGNPQEKDLPRRSYRPQVRSKRACTSQIAVLFEKSRTHTTLLQKKVLAPAHPRPHLHF